jgi:hypothetical protein
MAALVNTAEEVGVQRFVYISYAGIEDSLGGPLDREASSMRWGLSTRRALSN